MASPPPRPAGTSCLAEAWGGVGGVRRAGGRPWSLDGVCGLRRGRWTRPRTRALRAAPRLSQASSGRSTWSPPRPPAQLPFAACAPGAQSRRAASASLCPPSRGRARAGAQRRGRCPGGRAGRPPAGVPARQPRNPAVGEAVCRPCRAGALVSLVWNFHPTCTPQAGQELGAVGTTPAGSVAARGGFGATRGLRTQNPA